VFVSSLIKLLVIVISFGFAYAMLILSFFFCRDLQMFHIFLLKYVRHFHEKVIQSNLVEYLDIKNMRREYYFR